MDVVRGRVQAIQRSQEGKGGATARVVVGDGGRLVALTLADASGVDVGDVIEARPSSSGAAESVRVLAKAEAPAQGDGDVARWAKPASGRSRAERLFQRQSIVRAVRGYFYGEGFLEIPGPVLLRGVTPEAHLEPFEVDLGGGATGYLTTSTEYQIKRLVVGGFERVFTLGPNFRRGELGTLHNPEFTMLEWARAYADLRAIEADCEALVRRAVRALDPRRDVIDVRGSRVRLVGEPWERVGVRDALRKYLGVEVDEAFSLASLASAAAALDLGVAPDDRLELASHLLERLSAFLGHEVPTFLVDWPAFMTVSAEGAGAVATRSELFIGGIEISDGFPALRGRAAQRAALEAENARRARPVRLDERYLSALGEGMPPAAGMALGVDRLVLVLTGAPDLASVLPFAWDEV